MKTSSIFMLPSSAEDVAILKNKLNVKQIDEWAKMCRV